MIWYEDFINVLPPDLIKFALVTLFSLLIGLEQRRYYVKAHVESRFGTDRTYTLIGILGFVLYMLNPHTLFPFLGGGLLLGLLLAVFYFQKIALHQEFGMTSIVVALITYCLAPLIYTEPAWLVISLIVVVLVIVESKETLFEFSKKFDDKEFITLAKFLVIGGVILPLLPNVPISESINISPYKFWLAIVAVSGISYLSYLLKKFVYPNSGIVLTGILGGLYSSTATTFILARKSKEMEDNYNVAGAIMLATTMMFVRIFILAFLFNKPIAMSIAPSFVLLTFVSAAIAMYYLHLGKKSLQVSSKITVIDTPSNPLEFKTSFVFGLLFIVFALLTGFISKQYGTEGIQAMSFVVGVTDIDPFIINIFQSKWAIPNSILGLAVINAITSNNLLKMIYGISLSKKEIHKPLLFGFGTLILLGLLTTVIFHYYQ